jgi:hypothetical protein
MWKRPRSVARLVPAIPTGDVLSAMPANGEIAHWGQYGLLEDFLTVLHRDGTPTYRRRWVLILHGIKPMENWERFEYRFDRRSWKFTIPRARIILPNGKERRARILNRPCDRWGYARLLEVAFGPLTPGAIVELEDQQDNFTPFDHCPGVWGDYALQTAHPCWRRRISLAVARPFVARFTLHNGAPAPTERQVGEYRVWTWDKHDLAGIEWDQVTPPLYEFAPWIDFSTLPNWKPVAQYYLKHLQVPSHHDLTELVSSLSATGRAAKGKAATAYNYAARDVRYGRPKQNSDDWAIRSLGAVAEELRGDCKDKSALLVALLGEFDIEARIVLVRTAQAGRVTLLPGPRFDHALVLAQVDGKELWLDPTGPGYSLNQLPSYDQGAPALILDRHEPHAMAIPTASPADHRLERVVRGRLETDGSYSAKVHLLARGDRAARWRWGLFERNAAARERMLRQHIGGSFPSAEITDFAVAYLDDLSDDLTISHAAVLKRLARRIQNIMLLPVPWLEALKDTGFFAAHSRPQPLLVPVHSVSDRHEIELPSGFSGYGLPFERLEECAWGRYQCRVRIDSGILRCERDFELCGGIVPPERCQEVQRFTDACIDSDASDVILMGGNLQGRVED